MVDAFAIPCKPLLRRKDTLLLTDAGQFVGNVLAPYALHSVFVAALCQSAN